MIVHAIESVPEMTDVLLWDAIEREWVVGHVRQLVPGLNDPYHCAVSLKEGNALLTDGEPVPVIAEATHWAQLPPPVEG